MNRLSRRVAALERARGDGDGGSDNVQWIQIVGGLGVSDGMVAHVAGVKCPALDGETVADFRTRVRAAALAAGERFIVIKGLPADSDTAE